MLEACVRYLLLEPTGATSDTYVKEESVIFFKKEALSVVGYKICILLIYFVPQYELDLLLQNIIYFCWQICQIGRIYVNNVVFSDGE